MRRLILTASVLTPVMMGTVQSQETGGTAGVAWTQSAYVKAATPTAGDHFGDGGALTGHDGMALALSGDGRTMAVGAPHDSRGGVFSAGAVYVYTRSDASWSQQACLRAANRGQSDNFGRVVALSADGNTMAIAAVGEASRATGVNGDGADDSIPQAGAVYVFARRGTTWAQQAYLKASNTGNSGTTDAFGDGDQFGFSLALSDDGNTIAVGAITEDSAATGINGNHADNAKQSAGAVYVFTRRSTTWAQQAYVKPSSIDGGDLFGYAVALSADGRTLAAGSYDEDGSARAINGPIDNERDGSGAVFVFTRIGEMWQQQAYVKSVTAERADSWGVAVALSDDGNTMAVGALDEDCPASGVNPAGCGEDGPFASGTSPSMGAVAVFVRSGSTWREEAYLKASNTGRQDWFGARLALSGDGNTVAATAHMEDSRARGIDGMQQDNSANEAGAAYVFTRTGSVWRHEVYVKASNTDAFDEFGSSVALSRDGRTLAIGARGEDSAAPGLNGNQADNSADEAGAVYVFQHRPPLAQ
jgi:hypothetical protein